MLAYILQVTICLSAFYVLYTAVLSRETFFSTNRWYLLGTLVLSLLLPFMLKIPWNLFGPANDPFMTYTIEPIAVGIQDVSYTLSSQQGEAWWMTIALSLYWLGVAALLLRFAWGLTTIRKMYRRGDHQRTKDGLHIIYSEHPHLPFSFFHWIFLSKQHGLNPEELDEILTHESAHVSAWHSIDVLFMELACIFLWPSPFLYLYRQSLRGVHEYLADAAVLQKSSLRQYGELLITQSVTGMQLALANHFFQSQLKNRIIMMTKHKSPRIAMAKYITLLPIAFLIMVLFAFRERTDGVPQRSLPGWFTLDSIPGQVYKVVEEMPRFPGCENTGLTGGEIFNCSQQKLLEFIYAELKYPEEAKLKQIQGRSIAQFVVRHDGSISDASIVRSIGYGTDAEVLRVINAMPAWRPGYHEGKAVDVQFTLPFSFKLNIETPTSPVPDIQNNTYKVVEEMPRFPGCENSGLQGDALQKCSYEKLAQFVGEHMRYPEAAKKAGAEGRGVIEFVVRADGQLTDGKVLRSIGYGTDEVMMDVFKAMQQMPERWHPGYQGGKAVDVIFTLPFTFELPGKEK